MNEEFVPKNRACKRTDNNLSISLNLIILAFFIVLCRFSVVDVTRVAMVSDSINDHFFRFTKIAENKAIDEKIGVLSPYFYKIYSLFRQFNTNVVLVDGLLTVSMSPSTLYQYDAKDTRREYDGLFRKIAETIQESNDRLSRIIYYIHTSSVVTDSTRAENFAKKLVSFGASPDNIVLSISERGEEIINISFVTVDKNFASK